MKRLRTGIICLNLLVSLLCVAAGEAQQEAKTEAGPVPAPILAGKTVFIANGGGDGWAAGHSSYSGGRDRAYNQFYAAIKSWGRYEIVDSPAKADLRFEIRFILPLYDRPLYSSDTHIPPDPQFRLEIRDGKSQSLLWGLTEHAKWAYLQSNRDKNYDAALDEIVSEVRKLAAPTPRKSEN